MYWAKFASKEVERLEDLVEGLILDMRSKEKFDWEQEVLIRLAYATLLDTIKGCRTEKEFEQHKKDLIRQKQTQKADLRKMI